MAALASVECNSMIAVNKPVMLERQLIDRILPYRKTGVSTVLFKFLGTLRMIVDRQGSTMFFLASLFVFDSKLFKLFL